MTAPSALANFANFKLHYAVEMNQGKVWQGERWAVGGQELEAIWAKNAGEVMERYRQTGDVSAFGDATTHRYVMIKNVIGWEPFRQTFRAFQQLSGSEIPQTNSQRFNRFLDFLSQFSATDVRALIPDEEKRAYEQKFP